MKNFLLSLIALFAALLLASCGGGGAGSSSTATPAGKSGLQLTIVWPIKTATRLIPVDSKSITAVLTDDSGKTLGSQTVARPATGASTLVTFTDLTAEGVTLTATAYPTADGTGVAQATGAKATTLVLGQTAQVTVTMVDTIASLTVLVNGQAATTANTQLAVGTTAQLSATALNAQGQVVLTSPGTITWGTASATYFTVSNTGLVTAVQSGTPVAITATEPESGVKGSLTFSVPGSSSVSNQPSAMFPDPQQKFVYAWGAKGIEEFSQSQTVGTLSPLTPSFVSVAGKLLNPALSYWVTPTYLYGLIATGSNTSALVAFKFQTSGQLAPIGSLVNVPGGALGTVTGDTQGKYLFVPTQASVQQYKINPDGSLIANGTFTLPSPPGGNLDVPVGPMMPIGTGNIMIASGVITTGSTVTPELAALVYDGNGQLSTIAQLNNQTVVQCTQLLASPAGNGLFYAEGTQFQGAPPNLYVTELYKIDLAGGSITDEGLAGTIPNESSSLSLAGPIGIGSEIASYSTSANLVETYFVNPDGSLNRLTPVGVLPGTMNFNANGQLGMYIDGNDSLNWVYVPGYSANVNSQFIEQAGENGLIPLNPPTVPD